MQVEFKGGCHNAGSKVGVIMQVQRWMPGMQVEFKGWCHNAGSKVGVIMQVEFKGGTWWVS